MTYCNCPSNKNISNNPCVFMSKRLKYIHCGRLEAIKNTICYGYVEQNKHYIYYHNNFSILSNIILSDFGLFT